MYKRQIVIEATDLACSTTNTDTTCGEDNGTATVSATGGFGPYSYAWSTGATTVSVSNLPAEHTLL